MIEIKIPKYSNDGKILKNEAGDVVYTTFRYNFDELGLKRKLMAIKFFELADKQIENPPNNDHELAVMLQNQFEIRAFEAILMRIVEDKPEMYNPNTTKFNEYEIDELGKNENWSQIQEIKKDFFTKANVKTSSGLKELTNLMKLLMELKAELKQDGSEDLSLSEMMEALQQVANINS